MDPRQRPAPSNAPPFLEGSAAALCLWRGGAGAGGAACLEQVSWVAAFLYRAFNVDCQAHNFAFGKEGSPVPGRGCCEGQTAGAEGKTGRAARGPGQGRPLKSGNICGFSPHQVVGVERWCLPFASSELNGGCFKSCVSAA